VEEKGKIASAFNAESHRSLPSESQFSKQTCQTQKPLNQNNDCSDQFRIFNKKRKREKEREVRHFHQDFCLIS